MSGTKSFPADNVKLHIASAADAPTGTMTVLMRTNRYYTDGTPLQTGEEYTVTKEWGQDALSRNWCEDVAGVFPETETPSGLTAAQVAVAQALMSTPGIATDATADVGTIEGSVQGWWSSPQAVEVTTSAGSFTLLGCNLQSGAFGVHVINNTTGKRWTVPLLDGDIDDHNVVKLQPIMGNDGTSDVAVPIGVMATFTRHALDSFFYSSICHDPELRIWTPPRRVATSNYATYGQSLWTANRLRHFHRLGDSSNGYWCYRSYYPQGGNAFSAEVPFVDREYLKITPNNVNSSIRFVCGINPYTGATTASTTADHNLYAGALSLSTNNIVRNSDSVVVANIAPTSSFTASQADTTMTVTAFASGSGTLLPGCAVGKNETISPNRIVSQLTGTTGQTGTYEMSVSTNFSSTSAISGYTVDLPVNPTSGTAAKQLDVVIPTTFQVNGANFNSQIHSTRLLDATYGNDGRLEILFIAFQYKDAAGDTSAAPTTAATTAKIYHARARATAPHTSGYTITYIADAGYPIDVGGQNFYFGGGSFAPDYATSGLITLCRGVSTTGGTYAQSVTGSTRTVEVWQRTTTTGSAWAMLAEIYRSTLRMYRPIWMPLPSRRVVVSEMTSWPSFDKWVGNLRVIPYTFSG